MISLGVICLIVAFICFIFAAISIPSRVNLIGLGLAFYMLSILTGLVR